MLRRRSGGELVVMALESIEERVVSLPWFHQIDLGGGLVTPGRAQIQDLSAFSDAYFADGILAGKTFLDIGCWDGFHSFEAHRRGAARVLATDHHVWSDGWGAWGDRRCFDLAREAIAPSVEVRDIDLPDLVPETVGTFDVVLFAGVFYHLRHPLEVMERVARLADECLIIETHVEHFGDGRPGMMFYPAMNSTATAATGGAQTPPALKRCFGTWGFPTSRPSCWGTRPLGAYFVGSRAIWAS